MDQAAANITREFIRSVRRNLESAFTIARTAELCADQGNVAQAMRVLMDSEDPAFQAKEAFKAALAVTRLSAPDICRIRDEG